MKIHITIYNKPPRSNPGLNLKPMTQLERNKAVTEIKQSKTLRQVEQAVYKYPEIIIEDNLFLYHKAKYIKLYNKENNN